MFCNTDVGIFHFVFYHLLQVDFLLPFVDSVMNHRRLQNIVRTSIARVAIFCFYLILTSSVIYYWTDAQQHGIYFWINGFIFTLQMDSGSSPVALTTSWECWMFIQGQKCIRKTSARKLGVLDTSKSAIVSDRYFIQALWKVLIHIAYESRLSNNNNFINVPLEVK